MGPGIEHGVDHVEAKHGLIAVADEKRLAILRGAALDDGVDAGAEREGELTEGIADRHGVSSIFQRECTDGVIVRTVHDDDSGQEAGGARAVQLEKDVAQELAVVPLGQELLAAESLTSACGGNQRVDSHGAVRLPNLRGGVKTRRTPGMFR
jgi:hypothetical protein